MNISEFETITYVRKPFEVEAFEVTVENIALLAPFIGELDTSGGTPFIKSDKRKVGNTFKVWPGFFVTALKGKIRCYSRKIFFEQYAELNEVTTPAVKILHGRHQLKNVKQAPREMVAKPVEVVPEPVIDAPSEEIIPEPIEAVPCCEHGFPEGECNYRKCPGPNPEPVDDSHLYEAPKTAVVLGDYGRIPKLEEFTDAGLNPAVDVQAFREQFEADHGVVEIQDQELEGNWPEQNPHLEPQKALTADDGIPSAIEVYGDPVLDAPTLGEALAAKAVEAAE